MTFGMILGLDHLALAFGGKCCEIKISSQNEGPGPRSAFQAETFLTTVILAVSRSNKYVNSLFQLI